MDKSSIIALAASALLAFLIRFLNVLLAFIAKVLGVHPPTDIPTDPLSVDTHSPPVIQNKSEATDLPE